MILPIGCGTRLAFSAGCEKPRKYAPLDCHNSAAGYARPGLRAARACRHSSVRPHALHAPGASTHWRRRGSDALPSQRIAKCNVEKCCARLGSFSGFFRSVIPLPRLLLQSRLRLLPQPEDLRVGAPCLRRAFFRQPAGRTGFRRAGRPLRFQRGQRPQFCPRSSSQLALAYISGSCKSSRATGLLFRAASCSRR